MTNSCMPRKGGRRPSVPTNAGSAGPFSTRMCTACFSFSESCVSNVVLFNGCLRVSRVRWSVCGHVACCTTIEVSLLDCPACMFVFASVHTCRTCIVVSGGVLGLPKFTRETVQPHVFAPCPCRASRVTAPHTSLPFCSLALSTLLIASMGERSYIAERERRHPLPA